MKSVSNSPITTVLAFLHIRIIHLEIVIMDIVNLLPKIPFTLAQIHTIAVYT